MGKLFNLLISNSAALNKLFSNKVFTDNFSIRYVNNGEELLHILSTESIPDTIILDEDLVLLKEPELVRKIQEQILLSNSLKDSIGLTNPVLVIQNNSSDFEIQQKIYNAGAFDSLPITMDSTRMAAKIIHMASRFKDEQQRISCSSFQQQNTIKNLVQLNKKSGIYNKATFVLKTHQLIKANPDKKYTILIMNLDRFKVFNDMFGFSEGDKILEKIGRYCIQNISHEATYGHIYADHFVICAQSDKIIPEKIISETKTFFYHIHPSFEFVARYGAYKIQNPDEDISTACDRAELALNTIKLDFTERFTFYNDSMIQNLKEEQELITDMVSGIQNHEFKVFFQPQYDYTTESLIGAEALVRWQHPVKGLISPALFIPVFERIGFITQLDEYIWEQTCIFMRKWIDQGLNPVPVSVNISRRDIYSGNLVQIFDNLLNKYNLTPKNLRLEITESAYMENPSQLIQVVESLRSKGFCLEMDDFGSGYSSLNTLKEVPVDILKLDMKFISSGTTKSLDENGNEDTRGGSILSSVVRMANWLHLPVIAEGIESKEQADYLKSIGCFHMQGFYFAKPMPAEQYEELLLELKPVIFDETTAPDSSTAAQFLDATTQSTLLFNSFVGGAAIIEWIGDNVEVLRMNDQYFEELGTSREDYAKFQKNYTDSIDINSRGVFLATLANVTRTKKSAFCEILLNPVYQVNQPFWVRVHLRHIGKTITSNIYYMSVENIDFRMQLLQLNTNLSEQLSSIMENIPCGIITLTMDKMLTASYYNEMAATMLGYSQSEFNTIITNNPFDVFAKMDAHNVKQFIYDAIYDNKKNFQSKTRLVCKDGSYKKVQFAGNILNRTDGTTLLNLIFVDIDEQERQTLKRYTDTMFTIFNEVFEIDFAKNTSRTIKADYIEDYKKLEKPLDESLDKWIKTSVVKEDQNRVRTFFTCENISQLINSGIRVPTIEYNFYSFNKEVRRLRTTIIILPLELNKYLLCNSEIPMSKEN